MSALGIVVANVFDNCLLCIGTGLKMLAVDTFNFERAVDRFHRRIVPTITFAAHRYGDIARFEHVTVVVGRILGVSIRYSERLKEAE